MSVARDGRSSERVLDAIDAFAAGKLGRPAQAKPFNAWRKLQMRWRLGYWTLVSKGHDQP